MTTPNDSDAPLEGATGLGRQLASFNLVFWIANIMEMVERLSYYGLRTVVPIYMVLSVTQGGPEFSHVQKGSIFATWAAIQSALPIITGGYADRYGYKLTVAVSIAIKIMGYLLMAYAAEVGSLLCEGANVGVPGHSVTYNTFLAGAALLAAGTAIFKPGIQGIIAHQLNVNNDSLGWSVFYQLVNVGGFLGPVLAGVMRLLAWKYVFIACAAFVALNYILLLTFKDPPLDRRSTGVGVERFAGLVRVFADSVMGIMEPRLMSFLVAFSGFWLMFYQLFDLLPNYIDDWIDSRSVHDMVLAPLFGLFQWQTPTEWHGMVPQEWMINLNAGMCMTLAFVVGYQTGKVRAMTAMALGILVSAGAILSLGLASGGWTMLLAIAGFSIGELMASPTKMRYFAGIAPPGKKGLYLGYINAAVGIGWSLGSMVAGKVYDAHGDKVMLARRYLTDKLSQSPELIQAMEKDAVVPTLADHLGTDVHGVRETLMATYHPDSIWLGFATIGLLSMVGLTLFDKITRRNLPFAMESALLMVLTFILASISYGLFVAGMYFDWDFNTAMFGVVWAVVFVSFMSAWLVQHRFGRAVGRTALLILMTAFACIALRAGWWMTGTALAIILPLLLVDLIAGVKYKWDVAGG
jgi:dipeptide/tripeptide permease